MYRMTEAGRTALERYMLERYIMMSLKELLGKELRGRRCWEGAHLRVSDSADVSGAGKTILGAATFSSPSHFLPPKHRGLLSSSKDHST
jgi:hypothetical protein